MSLMTECVGMDLLNHWSLNQWNLWVALYFQEIYGSPDILIYQKLNALNFSGQFIESKKIPGSALFLFNFSNFNTLNALNFKLNFDQSNLQLFAACHVFIICPFPFSSTYLQQTAFPFIFKRIIWEWYY